MSSPAHGGLESVGEPWRVLGRRVVHLAETASTMDEVWRRSREDEGEGLVVVADAQSAGRGRHGRQWTSAPGQDLLLSVLAKPRPSFAHELLIMASLACAAAAYAACGREMRIKWPNDVRCDGLKLAGVLAESRQDADGIAVVIGIGLNVNMDPALGYGAPGATSLRSITGRSHSRADVLRTVLDEMDSMYSALRSGETLVPEWRRALETIGQPVTVSSADPRAPGVIVEGIARDVDDQGRLLVEGADGMTRAVAAGEVTLRIPSGEG